MYIRRSKRVLNTTLRIVTAVFIMTVLLLTGSVHAYANGSSTLEEAKALLEMFYVSPLTNEEKQAQSIQDLINSLEDPYTGYMSPDAYQQFINSLEMEFSGIGATVEKVEEGIILLSIFKGSGAEDAGLKSGDILLEADGKPLMDLDVNEAITYIRGEEGSEVNLKIKRDMSIFSIKVTRKKVTIPSIITNWLDDGVAYIEILSFASDTADDFEKALIEMEQKQPLGYVIDLRGNGGGYLESALEIAGHFIGNEIVIKTSSKAGDAYYRAYPQKVRIDKPVLLLVDNWSASASEVLSGALQDHGKAYLVGSNTYGKGSMQIMYPLSDGSVLKITTDYFYTPEGRQINGVGLKPDFETGDEITSLYTSVLLLGGDAEKRTSKENFTGIKIKDADTIFDIDMNTAREDEYWEIYYQLVSKSLLNGHQLLLGTADGWQPLEMQGDWSAVTHKWYYPEYSEMPIIENIPRDKEFVVDFSKPVDINSVWNKIQLINSNTGERIGCSVSEVEAGNTGRSRKAKVKVTPNELLDKGTEYYLILQEGILAKDGTALKQGVLCRAVVGLE